MRRSEMAAAKARQRMRPGRHAVRPITGLVVCLVVFAAMGAVNDQLTRAQFGAACAAAGAQLQIDDAGLFGFGARLRCR